MALAIMTRKGRNVFVCRPNNALLWFQFFTIGLVLKDYTAYYATDVSSYYATLEVSEKFTVLCFPYLRQDKYGHFIVLERFIYQEYHK